MESITKELREWFESGYVHEFYGDGDGDFKKVTTPWFGWRTVIEGMLDRIDEAHKHAIGYVDDRDPETMAENGWVKLPVDVDGEVWNVGDFAVGEVNPRNPKAIERMIWYGPDSGWQLETDTIIYPCPDRPRHHHAPTVEDVLREIVHKCQPTYSKDGSYTTGLTEEEFAEYAKKLQLRED